MGAPKPKAQILKPGALAETLKSGYIRLHPGTSGQKKIKKGSGLRLPALNFAPLGELRG